MRREAARGDGERLMEREDLDVRGRPYYSDTGLRQMHMSLRLWCEFHRVVLDSYDGNKYFVEGGRFLID